MALAGYTVLALIDGRTKAAGWVFGAATVMQPLVLLALPVLVAYIGRRQARGLLTRALAPSVALLAAPLLSQPSATWHTLFDQPNFPLVDHVTPFTSLAPSMGNHEVAGGPGRIVAVVAATVLAIVVHRRVRNPAVFVWAIAVALGLRSLTESVMDPYYIYPSLVFALTAALFIPGWRPVLATVVVMAVSVGSNFRAHEWWVWWGLVVGAVVATAALAAPLTRVKAPAGDPRRDHPLNLRAPLVVKVFASPVDNVPDMVRPDPVEGSVPTVVALDVSGA